MYATVYVVIRLANATDISVDTDPDGLRPVSDQAANNKPNTPLIPVRASEQANLAGRQAGKQARRQAFY